MRRIRGWLIAVTLLGGLCGISRSDDSGQPSQKLPPELGRIPFSRDYAAAVKQAKAEKKPLFVLFDEVPG